MVVTREFPRALRIAQQMRRDLAELIRLEVKDPRVGLVTITDVEVSRDLSHAKIYVTALGEPAGAAHAVAALQHAAGFLRSQLSHSLKLRSVPQLHFVYDQSVEQGVRLSRLIDEALAEPMSKKIES